jgi:hypothetical protein
MYEPIVKVAKNAKGKLVVDSPTEVEGLEMDYSFHSFFPDEFYPKYQSNLTIPKVLSLLRIVACKNGKMVGKMMTIPEMSLHQ